MAFSFSDLLHNGQQRPLIYTQIKKPGERPGRNKENQDKRRKTMTYRLTEKRLREARPILDAAFEFLVEMRGAYLPAQFERDMTRCWGVGHKELKQIMDDLLRHDQYKYVAVRYMECNFCRLTRECQAFLKKFHGIKTYDEKTYPEIRKPFWDEFIALHCR